MKTIMGLPERAARPDEMVSIDLEMFGQEEDKLHHPDQGTFASMQVGMGEDVYVITDKLDVPKMMERINPAKTWAMHNASYDLRHLQRYTNIVQRPIHDTMLYEKLMWASYYNSFGLADLSRRYLHERLDKNIREGFSTATEMSPEMLEYAAKDAVITLAVADIQRTLAPTLSETVRVYREIEEPALWAILDFQPVKIDVGAWEGLAETFTQKAAEIEAELGVNVQSPKKVLEFLYQQTGRRFESTGAEVLKPYAREHPVIDRILLARSYRVNKQTYGLGWLEKHLLPGDLVRTNFNQIGAETGRMTASDPALYNIPARQFPEFRRTITHKNGGLLICDISQQEPRILAYLSEDKELLYIFRNKQDVHLMVARWVFNDESMQKSDPRRSRYGKTINLGTSYGLSAYGLSNRTDLTEEEAQAFLDRYFKKFRGVKAYIDLERRKAVHRGYVETAFGRRVWVNPYSKQADNNAINSPIQGGGADQMKLWLSFIHKETKSRRIPYPVVINPYDELVMDVPPDMKDEYLSIAMDALTQVSEYLYPGVPFASEPAYGDNWGVKE